MHFVFRHLINLTKLIVKRNINPSMRRTKRNYMKLEPVFCQAACDYLISFVYIQDLSNLIVYCQAKHIKPWCWIEQQQSSVCNMFSFGEHTALSKCKEYPQGSQVTNYTNILCSCVFAQKC